MNFSFFWRILCKFLLLLLQINCFYFSFAFIFSLLSLLSLFLSFTFSAAKHSLEDDNSRYAWLGLLSLKRKEASLAVGLGMLSS